MTGSLATIIYLLNTLSIMFYKKTQQKINGLWYPQSITWGKAVTSNQVADQLALLSTVTRGDAYAIIKNLGSVLSLYMAQGRTVKIDGVGTFYYTAAANKNGVKTSKEVSASQIAGVRVRFIPEVERDINNKVVTRSMVDSNICWEEWGKTSASGNGGNGDDTGGGEEENPLG
ncbi:putative DNA-binding protein [Bacteroides clarus YIT 12056]|jgi:predicted histone-like DNA-binding protein|uniref:DNA-binding protein n=2 Tax=Bacteroides clarus TaxID=626929 RepID=A0ABN0CLI0_9BACE|nr:putative DNA-binding protein [Bacteroides clarus YIT 12056]